MLLLVLGGCGGKAYVYSPVESTAIVSRAQEKSDGLVTVRTAVPGSEETNAIFGAPLYDSNVQPVWLEVVNESSEPLRFAPVGTDKFYFSPLEVAWKHRKPFSKEARIEMERRFDDLAMPRYVLAGETASGFVFTNLRIGVKAFNVDLYGNNRPYDFTFLAVVPGFDPDYANIDFNSLYSANEYSDVSADDLLAAISDFGCCATDEQGKALDSPINVVLIGEGIDILKSLLRGNWRGLTSGEADSVRPSFLFGRKQDAIFRYETTINSGYYEIRLWLAPVRVDQKMVWAAEAKHIISNAWSVTRRDPDVDLARAFLIQNMWYSQSLEEYGWAPGMEVVPVESIWGDLFKTSYFTDGNRNVMWLSGDPVSLKDTRSRPLNKNLDSPNE